MVEIMKRGPMAEDGMDLDAEGLRASVSRASLPDLVQMECLAQSESAFRVISGGRVGYLFFQRGQVVHAFVDDLVGERAALEILGWQRGSFEPSRLGRPAAPTIHTSWQHLLMSAAQLLMSAAQRRDDGRRSSPPSAPRRSSLAPEPATPSRKRPLTPPSKPGVTVVALDAGPAADAFFEEANDISLDHAEPRAHEFVRLDAAGNVTGGRGDVETLAQVASYAARLAELVGDALGMGRFTALEAALEDEHHGAERRIVHADASGGLFALAAPCAADLSSVRKKLDL